MISLSTTCASLPAVGYARKIIILVLLASLADWLFYRQPVGVSIALFLAALELAAAATNPLRARLREVLIASGVLVAGLAPLLVGMSLLAVLFAIMATAYAALVLVSPERSGWRGRISQSFWLVIDGTWQGFADVHNWAQQWSQSERGSARNASLVTWIIPIALSGIFILLFALANPLVEHWFTRIDPRAAFAELSLPRVVFWVVVSLLVWPFVFMRGFSTLRQNIATEFGPVEGETATTPDRLVLLNPPTVVRCLIIFNILFAVQTVLDLMYLWSGVALPDGMSYATYAHRGAYPLILTALLAGGFVIAAMRPGSDTERSGLVRNLVFLWTGQNVLLVISSMLRLDLYVEVYSLTYLRVAAFIWMGLVATGLVLIATRIAFGQTNSWLIRMNLVSLVVVLYVCCFVNFPKIIAEYNVAHSREMSGEGVALDAGYLLSLGPQAIPAVDRYLERQRNVLPLVATQRNTLAYAHLARLQNWRAWTYQDWQVARYLREFQSGPAAGAK
jgi:hypothetical protein